MKLMSCDDLTVSYEGRPAVSQVSFDLEAGDYLCVVGENGSGKSTLVKGILGLIRPSGGQISFHGLKPWEIGYLPQQTVVQKDFPASVQEVVLSGCLNRLGRMPFYSEKEKNRANENMERLGIDALRRKSYRTLSGGQQQRVLLARALCATEKLVFLDEPMAGLDPVVTEELYALIQKLNKDQGITVFMVSHDIRSAVKYGNKILHLENRPLFFGLTGDYKATGPYRRMMGGAEYV